MCYILCRCPLCYDCPSCQHTLSVRATNVTAADAEGHATPRKAYYLACGFCRWTSRDIGLKDQFVGWWITMLMMMMMIIIITTVIMACTVVQAVVKANSQSSGKFRPPRPPTTQIWDGRRMPYQKKQKIAICATVWPILTKLGMLVRDGYLESITHQHAQFC